MQFSCAALEASNAAVIVTSTPLLASVAAYQLVSKHLRAGRETWERTATLSFPSWLASKWREARYSAPGIPALLSPVQEHLLWRDVIRDHHPELFDLNAAATLARRAAETIEDWRIPVEESEWTEHEDARQFQSWRRSFRERCRQNDWITRAELRNFLPEWISRGYCTVEDTLFAGFDAVSPALNAIVQACGRKAQLTSHKQPPRARAEALELADFESELDHAARWARNLIESNPKQSVAVFVPGLDRHQEAIEDVFRHVFYPPSIVYSGFDRARAAFQIHAGSSLLEEPLVSAALLFFELAKPSLHLNEASAILRSRYLAGAREEASARALADLKLRSRRPFELDLRQLEHACEGCPKALAIFRELRRFLAADRPDTFSGWAKFFSGLLQTVGWPGDSDLSDNEQTVINKWKDALSEFTSLGLISQPHGFDSAVQELRRIVARTTSVGPEFAAPVQILDAASAACLRFDAALAIGMCDENWPVYSSPSSLIPLKLQRLAGVPGSTAESRREQGISATVSVLVSARSAAVTYSGRLAPVIAGFVTRVTSEPAIWNGKTAVQSFAHADLEALQDAQGPAYQSEEVLSGGTSIIKSQSACAFRAFAEHRLHAVSPENPCLGFDARDRGTFLHKAMELLWRELKNSATLSRLTSQELGIVVDRAIDGALSFKTNDYFKHVLSTAERQRLKELINDWLEIERNRKHPFSVEILEQQREVEIGGLRFTVRADRIDRLSNGASLLVDYKTGKTSSSALDCPRPKEPQLLIYAATEPAVAGMVFAQIRADDVRPIGLMRADYWNAPKLVYKKFDTWLDEARDEVEKLATEFVSGNAAINPESDSTCKYCGAAALCRRSEWSLDAESDGGDR